MGLAGQVHHTLPLGPHGRPTSLPAAFNPSKGVSTTLNLTYTEEWVQHLLHDAYRKSPLYWHYSMRHTPSQSTVCRRTAPRMMMNSTPAASTLPAFGWDRLTLGGAGTDCFCGWWRNATHCQPPPTLCAALLNLAYTDAAAQRCALYAAGSFDMAEAIRRMLKLTSWKQQWPCPALAPSDHWGFLSTNLSLQTDRILNHGPSGLRAGAMQWFLLPTSNIMDPSQQQEPPPPPLQCDPTTPPSLINHFIDDLFPAAQGVRHSAPVSYCMRFVVELARLKAYEDADLTLPASDQRRVVDTWRKRCDLKLQQTTFCETYGVFHVPGTSALTECPFAVVSQYPHIVTPACLVLYLDIAYDPCLCNPAKFCTPSTPKAILVPPTDLVNNRAICAVPHPRDLVVDAQTGRTQWPINHSSSSASSIPVSLVRAVVVTRASSTLRVPYTRGPPSTRPRTGARARGDSCPRTTPAECSNPPQRGACSAQRRARAAPA